MELKRRIKINDVALKKRGDYVLYWMQAAQRTQENHALYEAMMIANHYQKPLVVLFILDEGFKDGNLRHFKFMLEGLHDVKANLNAMKARFVLKRSAMIKGISPYLQNATAIIMDDAYLKPLRALKARVAKLAQIQKVPAFYVPSNVIVPVDKASDKLEYAARTIRKKLRQKAPDYLGEIPRDITLDYQRNKSDKIPKLDEIKVPYIEPVEAYIGGENEALKRLEAFLAKGLYHYDNDNFDPAKEKGTSHLSAYLHFGHIAPTLIYRKVKQAALADEKLNASANAFLEQLLVRRELAHNFVWYLDGYDTFEAMSVPWAYETMKKHKHDQRPYLYNKDDYLKLKTHDVYFNAAMAQMLKTGYMHNRMRMYWGKKIIEWSQDYETAYETILSLNNTYLLDGRDPSTYASVAWCFGRHDQAWKERAIFGKLRYMNEKGLKRKSHIDDYLKRWL